MRTHCLGRYYRSYALALVCVGALSCAQQDWNSSSSLESSKEAASAYATGFRILSDHDTYPGPTGIYPVNGLTAGAAVGTAQCQLSDNRCLWYMLNGMIFNAAAGLYLVAGPDLTAPILDRNCGPSRPGCYWAWVDGILKSALNYVPLNAAYGPDSGILVANSACTSSNPDCTWTLEHVSIRSNANTMFGWNAFGSAYDGATVGLWGCDNTTYKNCFWTMKQGIIFSAQNLSLAVVYQSDPFNPRLYMSPIRSGESYRWTIDYAGRIGARDTPVVTAISGPDWGEPLHLSAREDCDSDNPNCTWSERRIRDQDGGF